MHGYKSFHDIGRPHISRTPGKGSLSMTAFRFRLIPIVTPSGTCCLPLCCFRQNIHTFPDLLFQYRTDTCDKRKNSAYPDYFNNSSCLILPQYGKKQVACRSWGNVPSHSSRHGYPVSRDTVCRGRQNRCLDIAGNSRGNVCCPCRGDCGEKQAVLRFLSVYRIQGHGCP